VSMRRTVIVATLGLVVACGGDQSVGDEPAVVVPATPSFTSRVVATGLESPWEIVWGPDDYLWVTERAGKRIVRVNPVDGSQTVAHEIPEAYQAVRQDGVLGMALHPELLEGTGHDFVYVAWNYDIEPGDVVDVRARIQRLTYDPASETLGDVVEVISGLPAHDDHLGGRLVFGPDEKLYFSIGDQGANWQRNRCNTNLAQVLPSADEVASGDWSKYPGTILRLNLDGTIPDDNPIIDGVQSHVFTYGHRNPQGLVFDASGRLFEVNMVRAPTMRSIASKPEATTDGRTSPATRMTRPTNTRTGQRPRPHHVANWITPAIPRYRCRARWRASGAMPTSKARWPPSSRSKTTTTSPPTARRPWRPVVWTSIPMRTACQTGPIHSCWPA